ncbi:VCBS repeat-containing protein, partial [bacterium]|nr:VCBS repeat-containing protein [bacterium]
MQTSRGNIEWNWINIHLKLTLFFLCISSSTTWSQIMVTNTSDSGAGSLRQAILDANANIGTDFIQFNIAGSAPFTIQPSSALPTITGPVTIDGTTQSGYSDVPLIEIEGTNAGSGAHGLHFVGGSATCTIKALVINRFSGNGIYIQYNGSKTIQGCYIGTDTTGTVNQGNGGGIVIENVGGNTIGGTSSVLRNTISGNSIGIYIAGSSATGNLIQNNFIGTDVTGTDDLGNTQSGIRLESGATGNQIGGTSSGMRNIISGNDQYGIHLLSSDSNTILGNFIGTDSTGTSAIGNTTHGIYIYNSASNTIGGTATGAGNVISANGGTGTAYNIYVDESNSDNNKIWGNYIGMDVGGTFLLGPTSQTGIMIKDGTGNHIGSNTSSSRNIISTTGTGIRLYNCSGNFIRGNYIGTNAAGTVAIASTGIGIYFISNATANTIGGDASGTGNVISGWGDGIYINSGCNSNTIQGNLIGTDADGDEILSNTGNGIRIQSNSNTVGGSTSLTRNVISGNGSNGIWIFSGGSNTIQGNYIGTDSSGTEDLGNTGPGILISGSSNEIGGSGSGEGNLIAYNGGDGIDASSGTGNLLSRNAIHSNSGLGIDLGSNGVTANDAGDSDTGANNLQNYPVIDSVAIDANTTIYWQLHSAPSTTYIVEFFYSSSPDPTGYGEGKSYLGTDGTTTDGSGNAAGEISIFSSIPEGSYITATATDPSDNTSEFSESAWEPGVTSHTPTQHAVDIDTSSNIQIIFNDDIDGTTINDDLTFNVDGSQSGEHQGTFSGGGTNTMTFDPIGSFEPGEVVTVTLTTGIQRTGGGSMADPYTFQFTIAAEEAPGVFHGDTITTNADRVFAACAADIDGDGDLDAVTASYTDDKVAWFENGNSWSEHVITTTADGADDVWAADLDGDGDMDVLAAGYKDNTIAWYENGNSWNKTVITTNTIIAKSVRVGDMDGDGDLDVVSASSTDNKIAWFENGNSWSETVISTGANTAKWVHVADIDSDGDLDVLSASEGDSKIAWYENGNSWNITVISTSANNAESVHAADIDGDGDLDVLSSSRMDNKIAWYENGNSWTETAISVHDSGACNVITADLDGDGDLDVATASQYDDTIRWYENGNGWSKTVIDTGLTGVNGIHTADLDNDGDMDLLAAVPNVPSVRWYENGSITVTAPNGGESWEAGDNRNITWTSSGIAGPITIECSTDSGSTWSEVAASTDNDGSYTWPVPATDSDKCLILISTADGWPRDTSDAVFTITLPPVDAPENLTIQAESGQVTVRWDQNSEPKLHKYNIYRDIYPPATTLIDSVVASSPPDTFYVDTDVTNGQQYYYRITAVDSLNTESDYSNEVVDRPGGGLVAYYPFNGDADDESGKGHNGTVHGATLTTDKFGGSDCAYSFDGDNDYISIPDNADQRIRPPLSIAFWINPDDYSSSGRYILSKGDASFRHYYFSINTVGAITFGVEGYDQNTVLSTTTLTTSQWYHIVGIHDGFTLKLY